MNVKLTLTGYEEIDSVLRGLPNLYNHRILQAAHTEAAKPMVEKMKQLAPRRTGRLAKSPGVVKPAFTRSTTIGEIFVGPKRGRFGGATAHFTEFGTDGRLNKSSAYRGRVAKKPWVEPSFQQTHNQVIGRIQVSLGQKTFAFMKRFIKKNG
jgi:hypothetical protein